MKTFNSSEMIEVCEIKKALRNRVYTNRRFRLVDVSGANFFGYKFDLVEQVKTLHEFHDENGNLMVREYFFDDVRKIASSIDTSFPNHKNMIGGIGAYGPAFNRADIAEVMQ